MRNVGVGLIVAAYLVLYLTSFTLIPYTRVWRLDPMLLPVAIAGITTALIPVRRGERWARLTEVSILATALLARYTQLGVQLIQNANGQLASVPNQRGGIALGIASVLAILGVALSDYSAHGIDRPRSS